MCECLSLALSLFPSSVCVLLFVFISVSISGCVSLFECVYLCVWVFCVPVRLCLSVYVSVLVLVFPWIRGLMRDVSNALCEVLATTGVG